MDKQLERLGSLTLVGEGKFWIQVVKLSFKKTDLVSHPARTEGLVNI